MKHEGPRVIENPDNYEARANIMWAGMKHIIIHAVSEGHRTGTAMILSMSFRHYMTVLTEPDLQRV